MKKIAFIIPVHNEQLVITQTLLSLLKLVSKEDIYVVNDGSTDQTEGFVRKLTKNILNIYPNQGKANALNLGIKKFKLTSKYKYVMPVDADTLISEDFLKKALPYFKRGIIAVAGRVASKNRNSIAAFRTWEYEVAQTIHKNAQSKVNTIIVCPGCSTIYKAYLFKKLQIPEGTMTEDMDLTFQIHRKKLGVIKYTGGAVVYTQDPGSLKDLIRQIDRWYTGFWQCVLKNNIPWGGQLLDLEITMLALEGLFGSLISLIQIIFIPLSLILDQGILLLVPLLVDIFLFTLPTVTIAAIRARFLRMFRFIPYFYFLRIIISLIFLKSFLKVVIGLDINMGWNKATRISLERS